MKTITLMITFLWCGLLLAEDTPEHNLQQAAQYGDIDGVKAALSAGANVNAPGEMPDWVELSQKKSALNWAAALGHLNVVEFLVAKGAKIDAPDEFNQTALFIAARRGHLPVVKFLLAKGASPHVQPDAHIFLAALQYPEIVKLLIAYKANVNDVSAFYHASPVMAAAARGNMESLDLLVRAGAKVNFQDPAISKGETALILAVQLKRHEAVRYLLRHGADTALKRNDGKSALDLATDMGEPTMIGILKGAAGTAPNSR